ncbi:hypothetical protein MNV49_005759 [Pseudohyphozyma bogoriensis]|nr:hypothetical protein MNV49_005759 [Pseudohyphozyma bogoriensis]
MIYTLSFIGLIILFLLLLWRYRNHLLEYLPTSIAARIRHYDPLQTFENAQEAGKSPRRFSTANFDLSNNIAGDSRAGLDERSLTEVRRIMERMGVGFDEGRRIHTEQIFRKNGIDPNGFPIDPKAVTSL